MIRFARLAAGAATCFAVVVCLTLQTRADDKEVAAAKEAVMKMTGMLGNAKTAQDLAKANSIENIMRQFKPRAKGGLGVGAAAPMAPFKDSIELMIIDLAQDKKGFTKDAVTKLAPDLKTMALQTQAIGEIIATQGPKAKMGAKDPAVWKQLNDEMKAAAADLAMKSNDPAAVKAAAGKINASCVKCHEIFRE